MTIDDLERVFGAGFCHGEKRAECSTCQTRERAIERVRRMADVVEAARHRDECGEECRVMHPYRGCVCGDEPMRAALRALDGAS